MLDFYNVIKNKPGTETNLPKIEFGKKSVSGKIMTLELQVTYYSGETEAITYKVNTDTGRIL